MINIKLFKNSDSDMWDDFVDNSINGTIFHKRSFLNYHPPGRFTDKSFLFVHKNKFVGLFPAALILNKDKKILRSHPGSSYGSIIVKSPPGIQNSLSMVQKLLEFASDEGCQEIALRIAPKIYNQYPTDEIDAALIHEGFYRDNTELSTCYPVKTIPSPQTDEVNIISTFNESCRRATRKALKSGLEAKICTEQKDFEDYWDMLALNLKKHHTKPTHTKEELLSLKIIFPDQIHLIGVFDRNKIVAGVVTFIGNQQAAHVFYFAGLYEYQNMRPLNLGVLKLIKLVVKKKLNFINFGISTENGGTYINHGLFRFKESFGGYGITRTYWVKKL